MNRCIQPLIKIFRENTNPNNAEPMKKYMKGKFEFLGIKKPLRTELLKNFYKEYGNPETSEIKEIVLELWNLPEREFQYCAISILRKFLKYYDESYFDLFEKMIITKSWWDTVDGIASWLVGEHFKKFDKLQEKYIGKWMRSENMWLQRTCILFQLHYKENTDVMLLGGVIMGLSQSKEFFIQKAIGWALREYSKTDSEAVINFVENNELAPLSKREAMK